MDKQDATRLGPNISEQIRLMAEDEAKELQQYAHKSFQKFTLKFLVLLRNYLQDFICYLRKKWSMGNDNCSELECDSL